MSSEKELTEKIASLCKSRSELWANERAQKLKEAALRNPFQNNLYQSHIFNLEMLVKHCSSIPRASIKIAMK